MVVLHHTNDPSGLAFGNFGVVLFYAISGFLAYYVLERDLYKQGRLDYSYFLFRRIFRIWPAYFVVIFIVWSYSQSEGVYWFPFFTFTLNWEMIVHPPQGGLAPLWSIAVEEQFYVLAPLIFRLLRSKYIIIFIATIFVVSNLARFLCLSSVSHGDNGVYYYSYTYADTFVLGSFAAHLYIRGATISIRGRFWLGVLSIVLSAYILRIWSLPTHLFRTAVLYAVVPLATTGIVVLALPTQSSYFVTLLSNPVLTWIGRLSYSIYLLHLALFYRLQPLSHHFIQRNLLFLTYLVGTAVLLNLLVERPGLWVKRFVPREATKVWPAFFTLTALCCGFAVLALRF